MTPDVNVLVAASRSDHPHHTPALAWLTECLQPQGSDNLVLLPMVTVGFLRIVTHSKIFPVPTPFETAVAFVDSLFSRGARTVSVGPEWENLVRLCREKGMVGGEITDAWIATAVLFHSEHLATFDRGFRRLLPDERVTILELAAS